MCTEETGELCSQELQFNTTMTAHLSCFPRTLKFEAMLLTTAKRRSATKICKIHSRLYFGKKLEEQD